MLELQLGHIVGKINLFSVPFLPFLITDKTLGITSPALSIYTQSPIFKFNFSM